MLTEHRTLRENSMSEHNEQAGQAEHKEHAHHIVSPVTYLIILAALLVGTALTIWASYVDLGIFNPIVALAIACT